ncbi:hypothetical protein QCA50_000125 [Cerrena zonata]|uniref:Mitochondrial inner membrane protease subunit 2 n=1 Tax=Cerrena zonata TaxID=2478898 RepID=A0AAW0GU44_9APHY
MSRLAALRSSWSSLRTRWRQATSPPPIKWTLFTLFWLPMGICFTDMGYTVKTVTGRSMQPTLNPDSSTWRDVVLFDRWSIVVERKYNRGDIVALKSPYDAKLIVKRIIALEGDKVKTLPPYPDAVVEVPEGHAWVEGDEPFKSEDSNHFGPVPLGLIESKLSAIIWPWSRRGYLNEPSLPDPQDQRSPAWRAQKAEFERAARRRARVEYSGSSSSS